MAAGPFTVFNIAKLKLLNGIHDLDTHVYKMALVTSSSEKNRETIRDLMRLREEACARLTTLVIADLKNCGPAYPSASDGALMSAEPCNATLQVLSVLGFTSRKVRSRCQYLYFSKSSRCQYL